MDKPSDEEIRRLSRYFAVESNNSFWQLSEQMMAEEQKKEILLSAFASLYHWEQVGNDSNKYLAYIAVARALTINRAGELAVEYATRAFEHFHDSKQAWIRAFTNAILSHALLIAGDLYKANEHYGEAARIGNQLDSADRAIFDATFVLIPDPSDLVAF